MRNPRPWRILERSVAYKHPLFTIAELRVAPEQADAGQGDGTLERKVAQIESNDWVNVVALDESEPHPRLVLIRQWRFGCQEQTLEIPGGLVDDGEAPIDAGRRELLEETGYACGRLDPLGVIQPNPALFNNRCHLYLARDLEYVGPPVGDGDEEIEVLLRPLSELPDALAQGEIQHALVIAALHFFELWRSQSVEPHSNADSAGR